MRSVGLFEAKQKLSELVQWASEGERTGITRRGKLTAVITSPRSQSDLKNVFDRIDQIRKGVRRPKGFRIKELIEGTRLKRFVLDASIALAWFLDLCAHCEQGQASADRWLACYGASALSF